MTSSLGNLLAKSASLIAGALIVSVLMIAGARAEAPFVFNETPGAHTWINWRNYVHEFTPQLFR